MPVEPSATENCESAPLPVGVTRNHYAATMTTLEDCAAVKLYVTPQASAVSKSYIIWRSAQSPNAIRIRPLSEKRIRDLRAGDLVSVNGEWTKVVELEVWR